MWRSIADDEVYKAIVGGYNDWLAQDYCAYAPERLIGIGVIPSTNLDDAVAELQRCAKLGLKAVLLGAFPSGKSYPSPEDDRFWLAALDLGIALTVHVRFFFPAGGGPAFKYPRENPDLLRKMGRTFVEHLAQHGMPPAQSLTPLVLSGVFDRFPQLKIFFAETRVGWLPFFLEALDLWYERNLAWAEEMLGYQPLERLPGEYVKDNIYFSIQYERFAVENRHHLNLDQVMFATDFPHIESEWPNSKPILEQIYAKVPEDEKRRIWADNAARFFKLAAR